MYQIIKNVINSKNYELTSMLKKIDVIWMQNDITDEQRTELIDLARANADMTATMDLYKLVEDLDKRVRALEQGGASTPVEQYPTFEVGKTYRNGDKVTFEGKHYKCICPSYSQCVWSPKDYPDYWKQIA